jgi:hypothetical protein
VFTTVLTFLAIWAALIVVLGAGTAWLQGYLYNEPAPGLYWRAPAAGTVLMAFIGLWAYLDTQETPGRFTAPFDFNPRDSTTYDQLTTVDADGKKAPYDLRGVSGSGGKVEYVDPRGKKLPTRPLILIAKNTKTGAEATFEAERDPNTGTFVERRAGGIRYLEKGGTQIMEENTIGRVSTFRSGLFLGYGLLMLVFLAAWFLCLWLLLQFQWAHALGLGLVLWLVVLFIVMPVVLARVASQAA